MTIDKETVLFGLAIYGATLSTWNLYSALRKERRAIRISMGSKMPVNTGLAYDGRCFAHLEVTNAGQRPVTIVTIGLEVPGGKWLNPGRHYPGLDNTELPITLTDGQTARLHYAYADIAAALMEGFAGKRTRLVPFAKDSVGNTHRGERWEVDPTEFAGM
ncbi:hypothetical protein XI03_07680 [Bradyrhizobium sp. CCBAU 65884]|uniref:hypothetical protein n=1 Tax=Bradyrhizobium sp. CCBAU 65884 TaxID=722477 RepID=UPI002305E73A|nr:hypothetical protein [Bradyrhizobium sp. CCBAU 65884]MDA9474387.1 hypothetical protein [Bradyrhizobium sp. CCBAU 65884]